jgi:carbon storage regulator CsrA
MPLVLARRTGEAVRIGANILVRVVGIDERRREVKLDIAAPSDVSVHREEVFYEMLARGRVRSLAGRRKKV